MSLGLSIFFVIFINAILVICFVGMYNADGDYPERITLLFISCALCVILTLLLNYTLTTY